MYRFGGGLVCSMVCYQICQRFFLCRDETRAPEEKMLPLLLTFRIEQEQKCAILSPMLLLQGVGYHRAISVELPSLFPPSPRASPRTPRSVRPLYITQPLLLPICSLRTSLCLISFLFSAPFFLAALFEFKIEAPDRVGSLPRLPLIASSQIHFLSDCNPRARSGGVIFYF